MTYTERESARKTDRHQPCVYVCVCVRPCRCPSWSDDEQLCVRSVNNELHFYENNDFSKNEPPCSGYANIVLHATLVKGLLLSNPVSVSARLNFWYEFEKNKIRPSLLRNKKFTCKPANM